MTREKQLEFCSVCLNRKMSLQKGTLCGLTNDYAQFVESCPDFKEDLEEINNKLIRELDRSGHPKASKSIDPKKNKEQGALFLFIGITAMLFSFVNASHIGFFVIPFGAIFYGARTLNKGWEQEKILAKKDALDNKKEK